MEDYFSEKLGISMDGRRLILVTAHRRESFGKGFENICQALREIALRNTEVKDCLSGSSQPQCSRACPSDYWKDGSNRSHRAP